MFKPTRSALIGVVATLSMLAAVPAAASAANLYVSEHPGGSGKNCSQAGYSKIQEALNAASPGSTIKVCGGTYEEQLEITKGVDLIGKSHPLVKVPATLETSHTTCEAGEEDLVAICMPETAVIKGMAFEANLAPTCDDNLYDIVVGGGATLDATRVKVDGATEGSGCQGGLGLLIGHHGQVGVGHASLTKVTVEGYNKNGITVDGPGSEASITKATITGAGPAAIGQNGIQVSRGAVATISKSTISDNECNIVSTCGDENSSQWEEDGSGVLVFRGAAKIEQLKLVNNDTGVQYVSDKAEAGEVPVGQLTLTSSKVTGGYASVLLGQGNAVLEGNKLTGGAYGIVASLDKYANEEEGTGAYAPEATSSNERIEGSEAAIKVESSLAGLPGSLAITNSRITGSIVNEDPLFQIG
jgi:Right handed beta helix region